MKSKTEYISFTSTQLREQRWVSLAMFMTYFVAFPIMFLLSVDYIDGQYAMDGIAGNLDYYYISVEHVFTGAGLTLIASALFFGVVTSVTAYAYLHNRSHVGLIHSLPIRREGIMLAKFKAVTLSYLVAYLIPCMMYLCVIWVYECITPRVFLNLFIISIYSLLMYWLGYTIAACAMLLTGKIFVGVCGTMVLMWYVPFIATIITCMAEQFFHTYDGSYAFTQVVLRIFEKMSPLGMMIEFQSNSILSWLAILFILLVVSITMLVLMKVRSSEAAGKAMAYITAGDIIKCALVVPSAIGIGLLFEAISRSYEMNWLFFGILFGLVISYIVIQLIYGVEFKYIFEQRIQVMVLAMVTVLITSIFSFDLLDYDGYIPKQNNVADMNISISNLGVSSYTVNMMNQEYNMGNSDELYALVEQIVESSKIVYEEETWESATNLTIQYCLNSGGEVIRTYSPNIAEMRESMKMLWANEEFLNIMYPLREQDVAQTFNVQLMGESSYESYYDYDELLSGNLVKQQELLRILQGEVQTMDGETIVEQVPVGKVYYSSEGVGYKHYECYIYPSFIETLAFLEAEGETLEGRLEIEEVEAVYLYDENGELERTYTTETELRGILPYLVASELCTILQETDEMKYVTVDFAIDEDAKELAELGYVFKGNVDYLLLK